MKTCRRFATCTLSPKRYEQLSKFCEANGHTQSFMVKVGIAMALKTTLEQRVAIIKEFDK